MIDWYNLAANGLWIAALALILATISGARWDANRRQVKLRAVLRAPAWQSALAAAGILLSGGLAATADKTWVSILWLAWLVLVSAQWFMIIFSKRKRS